MANKKKTIDAVASSRRWRQATSKLLNKMTAEQQIAFLNGRLASWPGTTNSKTSRVLARR